MTLGRRQVLEAIASVGLATDAHVALDLVAVGRRLTRTETHSSAAIWAQLEELLPAIVA